MSEDDFSNVCSKIDGEKEFLNAISQKIWNNPELAYKEEQAHETLTSALSRYGFEVQKNYLLPTAFRAEFSSKAVGGPVVAILLEYDALPNIGHACGHNLISEAGLAASLGVKAAMEADPKLVGTLVVLGTPAEEGGGGKIDLLNMGAFKGIDAAMMVHPSKFTSTFPPVLSVLQINVDFKGKEAHAAAFPWEGRNALDAAVAAYQNIGLLRQHIKPSSRIHAIITKGGVIPNIIPADSRLEVYVRAASQSDLNELTDCITNCIKSGATAARCTDAIEYKHKYCYLNLITNKILGDTYDYYAHKLGIIPTYFPSESMIPAGSTDMGNVSHVIPSIHPFYDIGTESINHTKEFTVASSDPKSQGPTLKVAKALAMTALKLMRCPETLQKIKKQFEEDIAQGL
ncbi:xaa-Arg dipeptidase-like isoform X2 [Argiope bruennichi]|uniref:xaa-Arg dipeptidase-like isoform X2 n=1 Tax=Argiope bruennichi TaxID=94029 RepID=UPI002493E46F|nr:xaa-Arg dipeptidase-like isoform X2 [Argiope bruennichi]